MIDKVAPGSVNWKMANCPPIKLPFKKVENCNQVLKIGKELKFSLVNIAGNDIVQGNKKLILGTYPLQRVYLSNIIFCKRSSSLLICRCINAHKLDAPLSYTCVVTFH